MRPSLPDPLEAGPCPGCAQPCPDLPGFGRLVALQTLRLEQNTARMNFVLISFLVLSPSLAFGGGSAVLSSKQSEYWYFTRTF